MDFVQDTPDPKILQIPNRQGPEFIQESGKNYQNRA